MGSVGNSSNSIISCRLGSGANVSIVTVNKSGLSQNLALRNLSMDCFLETSGVCSALVRVKE